VDFNFGRGTASFRMRNVVIDDYHDFPNSIGLANPAIPVVHGSTVSFDTRWQATKPVIHLRDVDKGFVGEFLESKATIAWSARSPATHFRFVSDAPETTTNPQPAAIGHERNGKFFA
jgi:hypothetical protein